MVLTYSWNADVYLNLVMNLMIWSQVTAWDVGVTMIKLILEKYRTSRSALLKTGCEQGEVAGFLMIMEFMNKHIS